MNVSPSLRAFEKPPPHRCIDGFLGPALVERLLDLAARRQGDFKPTKVGNSEKGTVNLAIRSSRILRNFDDLRAGLEDRFAAILDPVIQDLHLTPIHLSRLELELVAHGDGAFYSEHIDTFTDKPDAISNRVLSGVYYFHRDPKGFSGGELRLHAIAEAADGIRRFTDIQPLSDRFVLFPSWVPHEVRAVSCPSGAFLDSRFAINCWYHSQRKA